MTKRKVEIEIECPDCDICGADIGMDEYFELETRVCKKRRRNTGTSESYHTHDAIRICEKCKQDVELITEKINELVKEDLTGEW